MERQFERVYKAETSLVNTFNQGVDKVIENLKLNILMLLSSAQISNYC